MTGNPGHVQGHRKSITSFSPTQLTDEAQACPISGGAGGAVLVCRARRSSGANHRVAAIGAQLAALAAQLVAEHEREVSSLRDVITQLGDKMGMDLASLNSTIAESSDRQDTRRRNQSAPLQREVRPRGTSTASRSSVPGGDEGRRLLKDGSTPPQRSPSPRVTLTDDEDNPRPLTPLPPSWDPAAPVLQQAPLLQQAVEPPPEPEKHRTVCIAPAWEEIEEDVKLKVSRSSVSSGQRVSKAITNWPPPVRHELVNPRRPTQHVYTHPHATRSPFRLGGGGPISEDTPGIGGSMSVSPHLYRSSHVWGSTTTGSIAGAATLCFAESLRSCRRVLPLHPNSNLRTLLDICFVIFLMYDAFAMPYMVAFEVPLTGFVRVVAWITRVFWLVDFLLHFATGFFPPGGNSAPVMSIRRISHRYIRSWFVPDLIIVVADWVSLLLSASDDRSSLRAVRLLRLLRVLRLVEVVSMGRYDLMFDKLSNLMDTSKWSEALRMTATMAKQFCVICWLNHCGCCLWFSIGSLGKSQGASWLDEAAAHSFMRGEELGALELYIRGFIWSTTTMLGESPLSGRNLPELIFQAFWLIVGLMFGSLIVSSLADMMWQLQELRKDQIAKRVALRRFLRQQQVDRVLAFAIQHEIGARLRETKRLSDQDVPSLSLLSSGLRWELRRSRCEASLLQQPLLRAFHGFHRGFLRGLCARAVSYDFHRPGKEVFQAGDFGDAMYHVAYGKLEYAYSIFALRATSTQSQTQTQTQMQSSNGGVPEVTERFDIVSQGAWFSEPALLLDWQHLGDMEAKEMTELVKIRSTGFAEQLSLSPDARSLAVSFASSLRAAMEEQPPEMASDIRLCADHALLVLGMDPESRGRMAEPGLKALRAVRWSNVLRGNNNGLSELQDEIASGQCTLVFDAVGHVLRVVPLCLLRLVRDDGRILSQVAKWDDEAGNVYDVSCGLPGKKQAADESIRMALLSVISRDLRPLEGCLVHTSQEFVRDVKDSMHFSGLKTMYVRTINHAELQPGSSAPDVVVRQLNVARRSVRARAVVLMACRRSRPIASTSISRWDMLPDAFVFRGPEASECATKRRVFMWLTAEEFQKLSDPRGEQLLREVLQDLDFSQGSSASGSPRHTVSDGLPSTLGHRGTGSEEFRNSISVEHLHEIPGACNDVPGFEFTKVVPLEDE